jgi:Leucine-rich repeat (LRR) protein
MPPPNDYKKEQSVVIQVKSPAGAVIHYTTDGGTPSKNSSKYEKAILVDKNMALKARAFYKNWEPSETAEAQYTINIPGKVSTPVFSPPGGSFSEFEFVNISTTEDDTKIYYTDNGDIPSKDDSLYKSGFYIRKSTTLKAITVTQDGKTSDVAVAIFTKKIPPPDTVGPVISLSNPALKNTTVSAPHVTIEVTAHDSSGVNSVTINGLAASLSGDTYSKTLTLHSGENKITVIAEDKSVNQNKSADTLKITYDPPPDAVVLSAPTHISGDGMRISWSRNNNPDFKAYKIYFSTSPLVSPSDSQVHVALERQDTAYSFSGLKSNHTYYVKAYVFDGTSGTGSNEVSAFLNTAPVFKALAPQSVEENKLLSFEISATDADGGDLTYSMLAPPVSDGRPVFDTESRTFSWTPTFTDDGEYVAKFEVTDNAQYPGRDTLVVDISVKHVNGDSLVVRNLLDVNGFTSVNIDKVCEYTNERVSRLYLVQSRILGQLTLLPAAIQNLTELEVLNVQGNKLTNLPDEIGKLVNLTHFVISNNQLSSLPPGIGNLNKLNHLYASGNKITSLPDEIGGLVNLTDLQIYTNKLSVLPPGIGNCTKLKTLWAQSNQLTSLPDQIGKLLNLTRFSVEHNQLSVLPPGIVNLKNLSDLYVNSNRLCNLSKNVKTWIDANSNDSDWESKQYCGP